MQQGWESTTDAGYAEHVAELSKRKQKAKEWRAWLAKGGKKAHTKDTVTNQEKEDKATTAMKQICMVAKMKTKKWMKKTLGDRAYGMRNSIMQRITQQAKQKKGKEKKKAKPKEKLEHSKEQQKAKAKAKHQYSQLELQRRRGTIGRVLAATAAGTNRNTTNNNRKVPSRGAAKADGMTNTTSSQRKKTSLTVQLGKPYMTH